MLERAFHDDTSPGIFLTRILPELHSIRHQDFLAWVDCSVGVLVHVRGESGSPWHVLVNSNGLAAETTGNPERHTVTVEIDRDDWYGFKAFLGEFMTELEAFLKARVPPPPRRIGQDCLDAIKALDATLQVVVDGVFADGPARFAIHLGRGGGEENVARIELHTDDLEDTLDRVVTPVQLYRERRLTFAGETGILARIGTILAPHLPFRLP